MRKRNQKLYNFLGIELIESARRHINQNKYEIYNSNEIIHLTNNFQVFAAAGRAHFYFFPTFCHTCDRGECHCKHSSLVARRVLSNYARHTPCTLLRARWRCPRICTEHCSFFSVFTGSSFLCHSHFVLILHAALRPH